MTENTHTVLFNRAVEMENREVGACYIHFVGLSCRYIFMSISRMVCVEYIQRMDEASVIATW